MLAPAAPRAARAAEPFCDFVSAISEAAQAQAEGRSGAAEASARAALAAAPRGTAAARARAALGLALAAEGRARDAADALGRALDDAGGGRARPWLLLARGEALLAGGRPADATAVLGPLASSGGGGEAVRRAAWREADALLAAGLVPEAARRLEASLAAEPRAPAAPAARLALAGALRALGDPDRGAALLRELWLEAERPEATAAGEALEQWRRAGVALPPPAGEDRLARAERLLETGRPAEALVELDLAAAAEPAADPARAAAARALALLARSRHADAEAVAAPLERAAAPEVRRAADLVLARAAARAGRLDEAIAAYRRVAASDAPVAGLPEWRRRDLGDEAAFLAAWLPYDAGDLRRAIRDLDAFARDNRRSRRADDARWFAAWSRYRLGQRDGAARAFARLERTSLADGAAYWRARLAPPGARQRALYRRAIDADPAGWYALLARRRLADAGVRVPPPPAAPPRPLPEPPADGWGERLRASADLLALGHRDAALAELGAVVASADARAAAPLVAQLAAFARDPELPFRVARDLLGPTRRALRWAHPLAAADALPRARALGVDPALLLAIMRRESQFRPAARSLAGAEGLLQLVPPTALRVATVLDLPGGLEASLADPAVNTDLGTHYLALLHDRFADGALVAAAYNAGPRAVAAWARERSGMPLDEWVESIPWRETRQYVKVVLPVQAIYRELWFGGDLPADPGRRVEPPRGGIDF